ncbi:MULTISPECIES: hypothetical protein [unclassified Mycolicibacterium]|uniref:hypothetical protein n=1 Tax=unclassified Mycolicibacterium TaxID=2636767 RepID=UPI001308335A|nr:MULTISPECIES: hypothetical protein [unclassified Mycolicibacterium]MUL84736.1 hypothetical protein [Mycolicibacterium sp. CBMA 329]MUL88511.1 hypothetical protein [Mycolicibacterium sp. CBMA 331]MUM00150.1 hypothetical protein [Mycolicibacterium sp. CBMA 334]MUM27814.1 hypothetical protein [Mycolicibacterium sp. CBMA 295]MUM40158.1 hypothetical protein [Mycolicibacterium sp. CBMA 247]
MPLIDVTCGPRITDDTRARLSAVLPEGVSAAVECEDEPYDGNLQPGDVLVRFHYVGRYDRFDIDVLIEVKSKWFGDRAEDRQQRVDAIRDAAQDAAPGLLIGVYLTLPIAAWAQSGE